MSDAIVLSGDRLRVVVDPGRGADILSVVDTASGRDVMFSTPWRARADAIRAGTAAATAVPGHARWLEQYRGGWQTLCPHAGPARTEGDAPYDFHGEASVATWDVAEVTKTSARLSVDLFSAPVRISRELRVDGTTLRQRDVVRNLGPRDIRIDYTAHPAFGDELLAQGGAMRTDARSFVVDGGTVMPGVWPGTAHAWPWIVTSEGRRDLGCIEGLPSEQHLFGWLQDFTSGWVSIEGSSGLAIDLRWDTRVLPFAWVWQESAAATGFPWFGRARVLAIEPSSTPTSGPGRQQSLDVPAGGEVEIPIALTVRTVSDTTPFGASPLKEAS